MLILIPFIIIILIIFTIDKIYYSDVKPVEEKPKVVKEKKIEYNRKNYIDKYLKK
jgi:hypothetical protein